MARSIGEVDHKQVPASDEEGHEVKQETFMPGERSSGGVRVYREADHGFRRYLIDELGGQAGLQFWAKWPISAHR